MSNTIFPTRAASRVDPTLDPDQCRRAIFARDAVVAEFGWRFGKALDQDNFVDVAPNWRRVGRVAEAITKTLDRHRRSAERLFPAPQPTHLKPKGT